MYNHGQKPCTNILLHEQARACTCTCTFLKGTCTCGLLCTHISMHKLIIQCTMYMYMYMYTCTQHIHVLPLLLLMKGTKVQTLCARAVAGAWCMAGRLIAI